MHESLMYPHSEEFMQKMRAAADLRGVPVETLLLRLEVAAASIVANELQGGFAYIDRPDGTKVRIHLLPKDQFQTS